ncbi:MAG: hypothetical protein QOI73_1102 [Solirubrobacteraceae bacterium]|nr:hypothetical protein [Solirubrobacteraceae bacterium]
MPTNVNGQLSLLRVHDRGTKYGPANDQIDVEVVVQFADKPNDAYGFQLRSDADGPARRGMLDLLRDGFNNKWRVWIDYDAPAGHHNGVLMRVWLTRPPARPGPVIGTAGTSGQVLANP